VVVHRRGFRGCLDALIDCAPHAANWTDWTPGGVFTLCHYTVLKSERFKKVLELGVY
jgi:hypothetical protein